MERPPTQPVSSQSMGVDSFKPGRQLVFVIPYFIEGNLTVLSTMRTRMALVLDMWSIRRC